MSREGKLIYTKFIPKSEEDISLTDFYKERSWRTCKYTDFFDRVSFGFCRNKFHPNVCYGHKGCPKICLTYKKATLPDIITRYNAFKEEFWTDYVEERRQETYEIRASWEPTEENGLKLYKCTNCNNSQLAPMHRCPECDALMEEPKIITTKDEATKAEIKYQMSLRRD